MHDGRHPSGGPTDIRDGLAIAQTLANDPNVLAALRAAENRKHRLGAAGLPSTAGLVCARTLCNSLLL